MGFHITRVHDESTLKLVALADAHDLFRKGLDGEPFVDGVIDHRHSVFRYAAKS